MNQQGAAALAAQIAREPGWRAETSYDARSGAWVVKAWPAGGSRHEASVYTSPFAWHYEQAQMKASLIRMKALRRGIASSTSQAHRTKGW